MKQQFELGQIIGECVYLREADSPKLRRCEFECRCGKVFTADLADVKRKRIQSCGCYNLQRVQETHTRHGQSKRGQVSKEYNTYAAMLSRCYNPNNKKYVDYGGRGILVCSKWLQSFENFYADMGSKPTPEYTIDRVDNDAGYSPENCRWATQSEQCRNRRSNRMIEYKGELKTLIDWSETVEIEWKVLDDRLRRKWPIERAFTETVGRGSNNPKPVNQYTLTGKFVKKWESIRDISEYYKVDKSCISEACTGKIATSRGFIWKYIE